MQSPHVVINKWVWHYRLFWWSLGVVDAWRGGRGEYAERYEYGTTLPHYLGTLLLWMPLAIVSSGACYVGMFLLLVFYPIEIKSLLEYLGFLAVLCGTFAGFQTIRSVVVKMAEEPNSSYYKRHFPGAFVLARKYLAAKIEGVKPLVTFVGNRKK